MHQKFSFKLNLKKKMTLFAYNLSLKAEKILDDYMIKYTQ